MSNEKHPISELMDSSLQNLRTLVDADTVVGEAITTPDGTVIIPVSKVSFGFASGGSDIPTIKQAGQFGGGAGGGVSVQPIAFLVIKDCLLYTSGTVLAHTQGGVPNMLLEVPEINEHEFGYMVYFFEKACAISGYLLGVNPFDLPGVESYKKNMFALLGKPGYESERAALEAQLG